MLLVIGLFLISNGIILIQRGKQALTEAESCSDPLEIDALKSVGLRRKRIGIVLIVLSIPFLAITLLAALLPEPESIWP